MYLILMTMNNHIKLFCFMIYMSETKFIVKEKTEKYKEQVVELGRQ